MDSSSPCDSGEHEWLYLSAMLTPVSLGLFEAGLFPGLNFALTGWYKRSELNKRCAVFFAGAVLAGAFGGIFGYALGKMGGVGGKNGWCWIVSVILLMV
jgi:MFS family permease